MMVQGHFRLVDEQKCSLLRCRQLQSEHENRQLGDAAALTNDWHRITEMLYLQSELSKELAWRECRHPHSKGVRYYIRKHSGEARLRPLKERNEGGITCEFLRSLLHLGRRSVQTRCQGQGCHQPAHQAPSRPKLHHT